MTSDNPSFWPKSSDALNHIEFGIVCLPDEQGDLDTQWLDSIKALAPKQRLYTLPRLAQQHKLTSLKSLKPGQTNWLSKLSGTISEPVLVLRSGLVPPAFLNLRLKALITQAPMRSVIGLCGNYTSALNPLNGLIGDFTPEGIDALLWNVSEAAVIPIEPHLETRIQAALVIPSGTTNKADSDELRLGLSDCAYVLDPEKPLSASQTLSPMVQDGLGITRRRLETLARDGHSRLEPVGLNGQPVTLHISHHWGGGIDRWIRDLYHHDSAGHHLVLSSTAPPDSAEYGQRLVLYARGPGQAPIQEFWLDPVIADTCAKHDTYDAFLKWLIARYGIGRIIVSSLIGHSLDCLTQSIPTAQVLHDFYPASPVLDADPLSYHTKTKGLDTDQLIRDRLKTFKFSNHSATHWESLRQQWFEKVKSNNVTLIAPSSHVIDRWQMLFDNALTNIHCIAHGFDCPPEWTDSKPVFEQINSTAGLHLVVVGRMSPGKGLKRLLETARHYAGRIHFSVLGGGFEATQLFGLSNIDVVLDYDQKSLPQKLKAIAPHAALFLSDVPETWNYVLSEVRCLGLQVIAPRSGSFEERINHGVSGLLYEPDSHGLIQLLDQILTHDLQLPEMPLSINEPTLADAIAAYEEQMPIVSTAITFLPHPIQSDRSAGSLNELVRRAERARQNSQEQITRLHTVITNQSDALERLDRSVKKQTQWAVTLESEFAKEKSQLNARIKEQALLLDELDETVKERTQWARNLESELAEEKSQLNARIKEQALLLDELDETVKERTQWARNLESELAEEKSQLNSRIKEQALLLDELDETVKERTQWALRLESELTEEKSQLEAHIKEQELLLNELDEMVRERTQWARDIEQALNDRTYELERQIEDNQSLTQQLSQIKDQQTALQAELSAIFMSRSWRLTRPLRVIVRILTAAQQRRAWHPANWARQSKRLVHAIRVHGWRTTLEALQYHRPLDTNQPSDIEPVETPEAKNIPPAIRFEQAISDGRPIEVSVIIPVYNNLAYTAQCLTSLLEHHSGQAIEIIVVNDCSNDQTDDFLDRCAGIEVIHNATNLGFIGSCNAGAEKARGDFLVFLNNDTQVTDQWLSALIEPFSTWPNTGIVGARLVYPSGELQEAGGIIFKDGSGWNYGRLGSTTSSRVQFVSEADYVSGACLAIRSEIFHSLGGFDTHYSPAYYEDTDLCFKVRELGLKVIYQPRATVIHFEGISSGTSEASGIKRYQAVNREKFKKRWAKQLATHPEPVPGPEATCLIEQARHHRCKGHVLVIDAVTPQPDHDSGSLRMLAILELLVEMGYRVSFMPINLAWDGRYSQALQSRGIETIYHPETSSPGAWIQTYGPLIDWVIGSRHYVLNDVFADLEKYAPQARVVFDTVDLHYLREQRKANLENDASLAKAAEATKKVETSLIRKSDITLVVSTVEQDLLNTELPESDIRILSNIHTVTDEVAPMKQRSGLLFVGGFQHPPNVGAARWLIEEILPLLQTRDSSIELHLIGSRMPEWLQNIRMPGLHNHGFVEDLMPHLTHRRVALAPLHYGAGVKGKVNQAMAHGIPVVATSVAAEGLHTEHNVDILIADDTESFVDEIIRVYNDENLWKRLSQGGLANVEAHFSRQAAHRVLEQILSQPPSR